ncbi:MAG TPA: response regulator transcription factor [Terriglobales bacterium]|nr:response regulator transcription factor [Terriglobales bacterium]
MLRGWRFRLTAPAASSAARLSSACYTANFNLSYMFIKLLLASDYTMVREGLRLLLRPAREIKLVGEAEHLPEAPKKFQELNPDVVLLDVPAFDHSTGLRTLGHIVQTSPDARAVVLTNNHDVSYARSVLAAGARGYVLKHSPSRELIKAVRTAAAGKMFIDPRLGDALKSAHAADHDPAKPSYLTQREIEVVRDLACGHTNAQTALHLHLTVRTIETYRARIFRKLHLHNRAELVHYAIARGLLS